MALAKGHQKALTFLNNLKFVPTKNRIKREVLELQTKVYRGITNYYQLAHNMTSLNKLKWVMETSLTKTLAHKHKMSVNEVYGKYGTTHTVEQRPYKGLIVTVSREGKEPLVAKWGGIPLIRNMETTLEDQPTRIWGKRSELEKRLLAEISMRQYRYHPGTSYSSAERPQ